MDQGIDNNQKNINIMEVVALTSWPSLSPKPNTVHWDLHYSEYYRQIDITQRKPWLFVI